MKKKLISMIVENLLKTTDSNPPAIVISKPDIILPNYLTRFINSDALKLKTVEALWSEYMGTLTSKSNANLSPSHAVRRDHWYTYYSSNALNEGILYTRSRPTPLSKKEGPLDLSAYIFNKFNLTDSKKVYLAKGEAK